MKLHELTLETICNGAASEVFDAELEKILDNIKDPNTGVDARKITLEFTFKPSSDRQTSTIAMSSSCKTAKIKAAFGTMYLEEGSARTTMEHQPEIFDINRSKK